MSIPEQLEVDRRPARRGRPRRRPADRGGVRGQQGAQPPPRRLGRRRGDRVPAQAGRERAGAAPDLVLLDLNLPRKDGREVLAEIKADEDLRHIPVVVLTTSKAEEDVLRSYKLHANAYVTKPVDFERFIEVVRQIDEFFVTVVKLPSR